MNEHHCFEETDIPASFWDEIAAEIFYQTGVLPYETDIPVPANDT